MANNLQWQLMYKGTESKEIHTLTSQGLNLKGDCLSFVGLHLHWY